MQRVSVASDGSQGDSGSFTPSISADGRLVAFESMASNLVAGDTNGVIDLFVHDRETGITERINVAFDGTEVRGGCCPDISADGRFVAFLSDASKLVPGGDKNGGTIYIRDRRTGVTDQVGVTPDEGLGIGTTSSLSVSADGRFIAFASAFIKFVPAGAILKEVSSGDQVFLHDRQTGVTKRVSLAPDGTPFDSASYNPSISADGRLIAFQTDKGFGKWPFGGIWIHDVETGVTERVDVASDGTVANDNSGRPSMNANGRFLAFTSAASNLVAGDTNIAWDVFVRDRKTGITEGVSVGTRLYRNSSNPSISDDGRFVAFYSFDSDLVPGEASGIGNIYVRDRQKAITKQIRGSVRGSEPSISGDGRFIAFTSSAFNENKFRDVFVAANPFLELDTLPPATPTSEPTVAPIPTATPTAGPTVTPTPVATPTSAKAAESSCRIAFLSRDRDGNREIYVMDPDGSNQTRITNNPSGPNAWSSHGRKIIFAAPGGIYMVDSDGSNEINLTSTLGMVGYPLWSPDGSRMVFVSQKDGNQETYVADADGANMTRLTDKLIDGRLSSWSPNGRKIAFYSESRSMPAPIFVAPDGTTYTLPNSSLFFDDIYVMDADGSNLIQLTDTGDNHSPIWSPDGTKIIFESDREKELEYQTYVMEADGSNQTLHIGLVGLVWSPDGGKIAVTPGEDGDVALIIMDADGSNRTEIVGELSSSTPYWSPPSWSPDSTKVAFSSGRQGDEEIYVVDADGANQTRLTNNTASDTFPSWSPACVAIASAELEPTAMPEPTATSVPTPTPTPTVTPTPVPSPTPTPTLAVPTPQPTNTATSAPPTETPVPTVVAATLEPVATPSPQPTLTPTASSGGGCSAQAGGKADVEGGWLLLGLLGLGIVLARKRT